MSDRTATSPGGETLARGYEPEKVEPRWIRTWEERGIGHADPGSSRSTFSMVIPPPNVTGSLHIGHALDLTIQDIYARWNRMQGRDVLWVPGTDHAGIATQNVVEKQLAEEGLHRKDLGRQEFERRVWAWKERYGDRILKQMRQLGLSCDWSRERFTLDPGLSRAVRRVFVELYEEGLVYRGEYLVNWCPRCETAISDLEVKHREVDGRMWQIRYPLVPSDDDPEGLPEVTVETTRPETMLGDTALAASPGDSRYRALVGRTAILPIIGRELPIIADDFVDPEFGTGLVKVTPAHDPADFAAGERHELERVQVIGRDGRMTDEAGPFAGMDRFEARKAVVERLEAEGALVGVRDHRHAVGRCDRCDTVVEPLVSTQWFVRMEPLAAPALEAVESGRVRFVPDNQVKVYREWMTNIRDWCISRQLWWGHRIPAWTCQKCGEILVAEEAPEACTCGGELQQETDVLDTWFSSGLWPFSTLGWPDDTSELRRYYPTDLLVTGYDILFFWVARMIFLGLRFQDEVPFHDVLFHGLVRDGKGEKMSKSRGNVVDPLDLVDRHGADALRFTLASMAAPGSDMALAEERLAGYRFFCNKLWNAARFALMNLGDEDEALQASADAADPSPSSLPDRWILSRLAAVVPSLEEDLGAYRLDEACHTLYHFVWHEYCDWYLEMVKVLLHGDDVDGVGQTRGTLLAVLENILRGLHPVMPFVTEEIWSRLPGERPLLSLSPWAAAQQEWRAPECDEGVALLQELVTTARRLRADFGIDPGRRVPLALATVDDAGRSALADLAPYVAALVPAEPVEVVEEIEDGVRAVVGEVEMALRIGDVVDLDVERQRLATSVARLEEEIAGVDARLENEDFLAKAPADVVEKNRVRRQELESERQRLGQHLDALGD